MQRFGKDMFFSFQKIRQRIKIPFKFSGCASCSHFQALSRKLSLIEISYLLWHTPLHVRIISSCGKY